jgi:hypothetical protein
MKTKFLFTAFLLTLLIGLQSCAAIGGIFKAGAATGAIIIIVIVALIIFIIARSSKK